LFWKKESGGKKRREKARPKLWVLQRVDVLKNFFSSIYAALAHATAHTHHATTHDRSGRIDMTIVVVHWVTFGPLQM
jgi:hypothetical protein